MNNKFYVSLDAARLIKEKWYDIKRYFLTPVYKENGNLYWSNHEDLSDYIPAITKAESIDWLESKGLIIDTIYYSNRANNRGKWSAHINRKDSWAYMDIGEYYQTRLEAEEAAIIKALELL